ncbi:hypothetical protein LV779_39215 [Streptomyces thinghirensis]|nr:hypothetical protein [Streptomyces thinghirensis]
MALPWTGPARPCPAFRGAGLDRAHPAEVADRPGALAGAEQTSLFGVVLAAWFTLLHR